MTPRIKGEEIQMAHDESDSTESVRRDMLVEINSNASDRAALEAKHGQVWTTDELQRDFTVEGFLAPFVVVRRKSDGKRGSLSFSHAPRFYFGFVEDRA